MILKIKVPTYLGVYKLSKKARERITLNLVRQRRKLYDFAGINIEKIIFEDEKRVRLGVKLASIQPGLFSKTHPLLPF